MKPKKHEPKKRNNLLAGRLDKPVRVKIEVAE